MTSGHSNTSTHLEDLTEIRLLMERSSKFLSLSGWPGIIAGVAAISGLIAAWLKMGSLEVLPLDEMAMHNVEAFGGHGMFILLDALLVLVVALSMAFLFSWKKARKRGEKLWSPILKRLISALAVPLTTGVLLSIFFVAQGLFHLAIPMSLIFYGLALVHAGRYTSGEVGILGMAEIVTGLAAVVWPAAGLYLWGLGFGIFHIVYGIALYYRYDKHTVAAD